MIFNSLNTASLVSLDITTKDLNSMVYEIVKGKPHLLIRSPGGTSNAMLVAIGFVANQRVTMVSDGVVASAALSVFLCGKMRLATPRTCFTFHQARIYYEGRWVLAGEALQLARIASLTESYDGGQYLAKIYKDLSEVDRLTAQLIASRTSLEYSRVLQLMEGDGTELSVGEALYYGFVDAIIPEESIRI